MNGICPDERHMLRKKTVTVLGWLDVSKDERGAVRNFCQ
jgi:hypothetical protein